MVFVEEILTTYALFFGFVTYTWWYKNIYISVGYTIFSIENLTIYDLFNSCLGDTHLNSVFRYCHLLSFVKRFFWLSRHEGPCGSLLAFAPSDIPTRIISITERPWLSPHSLALQAYPVSPVFKERIEPLLSLWCWQIMSYLMDRHTDYLTSSYIVPEALHYAVVISTAVRVGNGKWNYRFRLIALLGLMHF